MKVFVFSILLLGYPNFFCNALRGSKDLTLDITNFPDPLDITTDKQDDLTVFRPYDPSALKSVTEGETPIWLKHRGENATKIVVFTADDQPSLIHLFFKAGAEEGMKIFAKQGGSWVLRGVYDPDQPGSALSGEPLVPGKDTPALDLDITAKFVKGADVKTFVSCNLPARLYKVAPGAVVKSLFVGDIPVWKDGVGTLKESKVFEPNGVDGVVFTAVINTDDGEVTKFFKKDGGVVKELAKDEFDNLLRDLVDNDLLEKVNAAGVDL